MGHVRCAACQWPIEVHFWNDPQGGYCKNCAQLVYSYVFPAINRSQNTEVAESVKEENEASCFYHSESRAVIPCEECGRFLCRICDCPVDARHLCPNCLNTAAKHKKIATFDNRRTNYDFIALATAVLPVIVFWPVTLISGPAVIYYSIKHWKSPRGILRRNRVRFVLAILIGLIETLLWGGLFLSLFLARKVG